MIKVLIVDDEPFILQGLKILIDWKMYGFEIVGEATNGKAAKALIECNHIDLIITDIKMPEMDGMALIEYVRKHQSRNVKIIVLSGYYEFEYAKQAIRYNVVDYILKPIQRSELIRVLTDFKEEYDKEAASSKEDQYLNHMAIERHLSAICSGIYDESNLAYVKNKLPFSNHLRYISIEMDLRDEKFGMLTDEEKREATTHFYGDLKEYIAPYEDYVLLDIDKRNEVFGVGFIYVNDFGVEKALNEREYIERLQQYIKMKEPYKICFYIGQKVEHIEQLSISFKSAVVAKSFQNYRNDRDIAYYDEMAPVKINASGIKKEYMDELVHSAEENAKDKIEACVDKIYDDFKKENINPQIIHISIDYLLCRFIYLANELAPDVNQEEILRYISQCAFEEATARGSAQHFKKFVEEFAEYLQQLRGNNSHNVLKEVEKEIAVSYMNNLSLKELGEKFYINSAYLGQIFKKKYNIGFKDYLNNYRIEKASELLIRTDEKVYTVAKNVGYNNLDYFINKFVKLKGKTPLQYRKQYNK